MKKITLLFTILITVTASAQFTLPTEAGPITVASGTQETIDLNNLANSAGVDSGIYSSATITADWENISGAWSAESGMLATTADGATALYDASDGDAFNSNATTLTFTIPFNGNYNPDVDGTLSVNLNQSYAGSSASWSNISVVLNLFVLPPDCVTTPSPADTDEGAFSGSAVISFSWEAAASGEPANSYEFYFGTTPGALSLLSTVTSTSIDIVGINPETTYYWQVVPIGNGGGATGCPEWSFTSEAASAPSNDLCSTATPLVNGTEFNSNPISGQSQWLGSDSGEQPLPSCSQYDPTDASGRGGDIWYSVVIPSDGNLTIEVQGPAGGDTGMQIYSGSCGSLVAVDCNDDINAGSGNFYSSVTISDPLLAGQTLFARVFEYSGNDILNITISAYSATLSNNDLSLKDTFKYSPNPVNNVLTLNAQNNIDDVKVYNMLGQEVMRSQPQAFDSQLDMSKLQSGAYFVQVTIGTTTQTVRIIKQ